MNILIPHNWLTEFLHTKATPKQIQTNLSLSGPSVERIERIEGEPVYDIEVTTNRVDMMSVIGIAREANAILPHFGIKSKLTLNPPKPKTTYSKKLDLTIKNDPQLCRRIIALTMSVATVGPSPKWLQKRLIQVGQRPLNNLIDITNYVMFETGHPIHVFDYDRLTQKTIIVRTAKPGEKFTTLDSRSHTTKGGEVVFDDGTGTIIDLPGIMGTKNTMVTDKTKNILVWLEDINSNLIRQASMGLAIRTQAAILNEKSVDPELGTLAIHSAASLFESLAKAKATSKIVDINTHSLKIPSTTLSHSQLETYLGISIDPKTVINILSDLGAQATHSTNTYSITPPSYRATDLKIPEDYIEEIARIYGYHNLPSQLMETAIPIHTHNQDHSFQHNLKQSLALWGAFEVISLSLVSNKLALQSGYPLNKHLKLQNPLTDDLVYLRRSIVPSHHQLLNNNPTHSQAVIFEIANTYTPVPKDLPVHLPTLTVSTHASFELLKGLLTALARKFRLANYSISPTIDPLQYPEFIPSRTGAVLSDKDVLGVIGQTKLNHYSISLNISLLQSHSQSHPTYKPLPKTAPIIEDLTFTLPPKTYSGHIVATIINQSSLVTSVLLTSVYNHNYTYQLTYSHPDLQLTDKKISQLRKSIVTAVEKKHQAKLVGSLQ